VEYLKLPNVDLRKLRIKKATLNTTPLRSLKPPSPEIRRTESKSYTVQ